MECIFKKNSPIFAFEDILNIIDSYKNGKDIQLLSNTGWVDINKTNEDMLDYHSWTCRGIRLKEI